MKGKKIQLNLFDGRNVIVDKNDYKTGDVALFDLEKKKITDVIKFEKNSIVFIKDGKYIGQVGVIKDIIVTGNEKKDRVVFKCGDAEHETLKEYAYVIGKDKSAIKLIEAKE